MSLLRIDHWKLFLLLFVPAIVSGIVLLVGDSMFHNHAITLIVSQIFTFVFVGVFVAWIFAMGIHLAQLESNRPQSMSLFKGCLAFGLLYRVLIDLYMTWYGISTGASIELENQLWIVPIHLLATIAVLYCFYLNAKLLVSAERGRASTFKDVWRTLVLLLAVPLAWLVGVYLASLGSLPIQSFWRADEPSPDPVHVWNLGNYLSFLTAGPVHRSICRRRPRLAPPAITSTHHPPASEPAGPTQHVAHPPRVSKALRTRKQSPPPAEITVDDLFNIIRSAAPFAELMARRAGWPQPRCAACACARSRPPRGPWPGGR